MDKDFDKNETVRFVLPKEEQIAIRDILEKVYKSLQEKGYDPKNQIIGYINEAMHHILLLGLFFYISILSLKK